MLGILLDVMHVLEKYSFGPQGHTDQGAYCPLEEIEKIYSILNMKIEISIGHIEKMMKTYRENRKHYLVL